MVSFYTEDELRKFRFKKIGANVLISRNASIYNEECISIGNNVRIDDFCILSGNIQIGNNVHIAAATLLFGGEAGIIMKDFTGVSSKTTIYATSDDYTGMAMTNPTIPSEYRKVQQESVTLEKHCLIGSGCTILPGVIIGEGTSVGSMSLVNRSLEEWGIYVGIPCRWIRERKKDILKLEKKYLNSKKDS